MNKMTEYECFQDYESYKLKNSICITKEQRIRRSELSVKCNLLPSEVSYFTMHSDRLIHTSLYGGMMGILYQMIVVHFLFYFLKNSYSIFRSYKKITKNIKQIEEAITQFETSFLEDREDSDFKRIEKYLAPDSPTYGKLTDYIIKNLKQKQKYQFRSFSINEIFWGDVKKREVIVEGTVTAEPKEGTFHERKWNRRYTIIHKKGLVRISDIEEMQMQMQ